MKFMLNQKKVAKKSFDFRAAEEALVASYEKLGPAYEALVAAEGRCAEVDRVMSDCKLAMESIQKFGVTATTMSIFNGKDHALDQACGLENLEIASLESMSASAKKVLQGQYVAGLEANEGEAKRSFIQTVKEWFGKLIDWLKELFTGTAKLTKMVDEIAKGDAKDLDLNAKVTTYSYDDVDKMLNLAKSIEVVAKTASEVAADKLAETANAEFTYEKKSATVGELKWSGDKVVSTAKRIVALATSKDVQQLWNNVQAEYRKSLAENPDDPGVFENLRERFSAWTKAQKATNVYARCIRAAGFSVVAIHNAQVKATTEQPKE